MISVIIPTYKPQAYIWRCLDSFEKQNLSNEQFEIIIILNGCDESYKSVLLDGINRKGYKFSYNLIYTKVPGVSNARNMGLDAMRGDYACFIDDDDYVSCEFLSDLLSKAGEDILVVSKFLDYDESSNEIKEAYQARAFDSNLGRNLSVMSAHRLISSSCGRLLPRQLIGDVRFNTNIALGEDALFMAQITNKLNKIELANQSCIYYRCLRSSSARHMRRPIAYYLRNAFRLNVLYARIYFSDMKHYNFFFFVNRILANTKRMFMYILRLND